MLVPNLHWLVVEDAVAPTRRVLAFLESCSVPHTYLLGELKHALLSLTCVLMELCQILFVRHSSMDTCVYFVLSQSYVYLWVYISIKEYLLFTLLPRSPFLWEYVLVTEKKNICLLQYNIVMVLVYDLPKHGGACLCIRTIYTSVFVINTIKQVYLSFQRICRPT